MEAIPSRSSRSHRVRHHAPVLALAPGRGRFSCSQVLLFVAWGWNRPRAGAGRGRFTADKHNDPLGSYGGHGDLVGKLDDRGEGMDARTEAINVDGDDDIVRRQVA